MIIQVKKKLELRTLVPGNADEVFDVVDNNREHLRRWLPFVDGTKSRYDTRETIVKWQNQLREKTEYIFGIFLGGSYIGNMGLHRINRDNNSSEIGYWLAADQQGKGIMTDCVRALANFGFNELGLNRIHIRCASDNAKSRAVPARLNFVHEGTLQDDICLHGVYHDVLVFGMVKRNWNNKPKKNKI